MDELKHCPFCGSDADILSNYGKNGWFVYCECVLCSAKSKAFSFGRDLPDDWVNQLPALRAVDAWNRRYSNAEQDH